VLERQYEELQSLLEQTPPAIVRIHPQLAEIYARKVAHLEETLNDEVIRGEAVELLRSLIEFIELRPRTDGTGVDATLHGDMARILAFCDAASQKSKLPETGVSGSLLSVVAGTGFEPVTFRL
jgi:hypothetical protein